MPLLTTSALESRRLGHFPALRLIAPFFLIPSLMILVGCASTAPAPAPVVNGDLTKAMFETAFDNIDTYYITQPNMADLAIAGLQQLTSLDPDVAAVQIGDQVNLDVGQQLVQSFAIKPDMKASQWGKLVAKVTEAAINQSEKLQKTPIEKIYEVELTGVISKLDPFSHYDNPEQTKVKRDSRDGFGGLGLSVSVEDNTVRIVSIIHYTPAERMGLKRDDLVLTIDGKPTKGLSQNEVVTLLRGPINSKVSLSVSRIAEAAPTGDAANSPDQQARQTFSVTLTRAHIVPESVSSRRDGDIAYIRIYTFNAGTEDSLKHAVLDAQSEIGSRLAGYILDLRGNGGGLLNQSVEISNLLLTGGRIVSTHGRNPESLKYFEASGHDITDGKPIIVIIDGNTASASEILTAALQDNDRAVVIGSNSYGKGTVQTVLDNMPNAGSVTLTWARYHAPSGYTLHHLGVLPTICTVGKRNADALIKDLALGRLPTIPTDKRNATSPDDTAGLDALRQTCPARTDEDPIDLEIAKRILHQPNLFAEAVHLAQPPATANSDQSSSLDLLPAFLN
jgi:carboxyl-terminal processing protease